MEPQLNEHNWGDFSHENIKKTAKANGIDLDRVDEVSEDELMDWIDGCLHEIDRLQDEKQFQMEEGSTFAYMEPDLKMRKIKKILHYLETAFEARRVME